MTSVPRVSVLMPVYDAGRFLEPAVRSILRQDLQDFELLALDDGSTDGSLAVLRRLAAEDPRIRVESRENRGISRTRNQLLETARAPVVAWMDADDVSHPSRLRLQMALLDATPELVCAGGWIRIVDARGWPIKTREFPADHDEIVAAMQSAGSAMQLPSVTMRRNAALRVGGFRDLAPFEDFDLLLRLSEVGRMANLQSCILDYRVFPASASHSTSRSWPVLRQFILDMGRDRRERGSDCLQRGELPPAAVQPVPGRRADRALLHRTWAREARTHGHLATWGLHTLHSLRWRVAQALRRRG